MNQLLRKEIQAEYAEHWEKYYSEKTPIRAYGAQLEATLHGKCIALNKWI